MLFISTAEASFKHLSHICRLKKNAFPTLRVFRWGRIGMIIL